LALAACRAPFINLALGAFARSRRGILRRIMLMRGVRISSSHCARGRDARGASVVTARAQIWRGRLDL
jgi:hypothetical protein